MLQVSPAVGAALDKSVSYSIFSKVIVEVELNGYADYSISFPESVEPVLFPENEVLKVRRPDGGLPKLIAGEGRISDITIDSECYSKDRSWYRVPSEDSKYKYFRTKERTGEDSQFEQPLRFEVEYSEPISLNHIVIGFENSNSLPPAIQIEILQGGVWEELGSFEVQNNGKVEIFYNTEWSAEYSDEYVAESCTGIAFVAESMNSPSSALELIQISPRITINISDRVINSSISKTSQESSLSNPIGTSSSNNCGFQISNSDRFFDFDNQNSIFEGLADVNVKFTVSDVVNGDEVPQGVFFAHSWDYGATGSLSVDSSDFSKFLQSQSIENSFYVDKDLRFVIADIIERAGIVDYEICFAKEDLKLNSPFYFFDNEQTVWEALQQIAIAEQSFYYFDNLNRFVWSSRDYWWSSEEVDFALRARRDGEDLANLMDYNHQFTIVANKATINYTPTRFLNNSNEVLNQYYRDQNILPVYIRGEEEFSNTLWELTEPTVLVSTRLQSRIDDDSEYFFVDPRAFRTLPETGMFILDAEYIKYSKIPRLIGTVNKNRIQQLIESQINQIQFAIQNASERKSIPVQDIQVIFFDRRIWPDAALGCPEPGEEYDKTPVEGYFIILRAGAFFLQYNGSGNGEPFLCGIADVTEEKENLSYWSVESGGLVFNEGQGGIQIENALFIEERAVFNSQKKDHDIVQVEGGESYTFLDLPPEIIDPPNRIFADTHFEDSRLKLRANRYDLNMVHHYTPNVEGEFDIYGAQLVFPATDIKDRAGNIIANRYLSQGIAGMFVNQTEPGTGYYVELVTSQFTNLTQGFMQNVRVWKYEQQEVPIFDGEDGDGEDGDGEGPIQIGTEVVTVRRIMAGYLPDNLFTLNLEEIEAIAGARISVLPESNQNINLYVRNIQRLAPVSVPPGSGEFDEEIEFIKSDISEKFEINKNNITIVGASKVDWPDPSLGWPEDGVFYASIVTSGYLIVAGFNDGEEDVELEYRGKDGEDPMTEEQKKNFYEGRLEDRAAAGESVYRVVSGTSLEDFRESLALFDFDDEDGEGFDGEDFKSVAVGTILNGVEIVVTVNGRRIFTVEDIEDIEDFSGEGDGESEEDYEENIIYTSGKWGVFSRGSTDVDFEFIYAINRQGDPAQLSEAQFAIRDQINGGFIDNTIEHFFSEFNELRNRYFFDDFGAWAREVKEFDVKNEISPAFFSRLFISQEDKVFRVFQKLDQFSSKFALGVRIRANPVAPFVVLSGDDPLEGFSMATIISGPPINRSETEVLIKKNDKSIWSRGEEEVFVDSPWIQTEKQAQRIADWVIKRWSSPAQVIEAQVVVDPRLEVGDLVSMSVPENNMTPETHLFHITGISKSVGSGPSMSVTLRRANF